MTTRFLNLTTRELNLKDFMTIGNAFKQAQHYIDETVFVRHAHEKLTNCSDDELDWQVMSLLQSTLILITDKEILHSNAYSCLWETIAECVGVLLSVKDESQSSQIRGNRLNLHTLLMTARCLVRHGNITLESHFELW